MKSKIWTEKYDIFEGRKEKDLFDTRDRNFTRM